MRMTALARSWNFYQKYIRRHLHVQKLLKGSATMSMSVLFRVSEIPNPKFSEEVDGLRCPSLETPESSTQQGRCPVFPLFWKTLSLNHYSLSRDFLKQLTILSMLFASLLPNYVSKPVCTLVMRGRGDFDMHHFSRLPRIRCPQVSRVQWHVPGLEAIEKKKRRWNELGPVQRCSSTTWCSSSPFPTNSDFKTTPLITHVLLRLLRSLTSLSRCLKLFHFTEAPQRYHMFPTATCASKYIQLPPMYS
jgi:hypothetical protein